jgi:hypothetical protein
MKTLNIIFIASLFIGCTANSPSVEKSITSKISQRFDGYFIDINANESLLLQELPKDFTSEYSEAKLICHQIADNTDIVVSDSVKTNENLHAKFFNDTIIIVPTDKNIWLYNLKQKRFFDKLTKLQPAEYILAFNITQDKQKVAFIVFNSIDSKFKAYSLDLMTNTLSSVEHVINNEEEDGDYFCSIYTTTNHIIFNLNNYLYVFANGSKEDNLLTNQLSYNAYGRYLFAVDLNNVIFIEGYDNNTIIKAYDLSNGAMKQVGLKSNVPKKYNSNTVFLNTIVYNSQFHAQLFLDTPYLFENNNFSKQEDFVGFKGSQIKIKRIIENNKESFTIQTIE